MKLPGWMSQRTPGETWSLEAFGSITSPCHGFLPQCPVSLGDCHIETGIFCVWKPWLSCFNSYFDDISVENYVFRWIFRISFRIPFIQYFRLNKTSIPAVACEFSCHGAWWSMANPLPIFFVSMRFQSFCYKELCHMMSVLLCCGCCLQGFPQRFSTILGEIVQLW